MSSFITRLVQKYKKEFNLTGYSITVVTEHVETKTYQKGTEVLICLNKQAVAKIPDLIRILREQFKTIIKE